MTLPEEILRRYGNSFKCINKKINDAKNLFSDSIPKHCFLDSKAWDYVLETFVKIPNEKLDDYKPILSSIFTWQYNKFIYRFNENMYKCLTSDNFHGDIPCDVFLKLPHHCIYIETNFDNSKGIFVNLLEDCVIFSEINATEEFEVYPFVLGCDTINESFDKINYLHRMNKIEGYDDLKQKEKVIKKLSKYISLLLYICSSEPDIIQQNKNQKEHIPIIKTRHGMKLLPAPKVRIFNVGDEIAKKIQEVNAYEASDRSVKAHIRRAHWHGYWVGKGRKEFKYNWIFPTLINVE